MRDSLIPLRFNDLFGGVTTLDSTRQRIQPSPTFKALAHCDPSRCHTVAVDSSTEGDELRYRHIIQLPQQRGATQGEQQSTCIPITGI
jgi:hypothetical protein